MNQTQSMAHQKEPSNKESLRLEAYHLAESVLPIFESVFPDVITPRMALPVALDVVSGIHDYHTMAVTREWLQGIIDDVRFAMAEVWPDIICDYYAACMAAATVHLTLAPTVNLDEVQRAAASALQYASPSSLRIH